MMWDVIPDVDGSLCSRAGLFDFRHVHGFDHGAAFALVLEQSHGYYAGQYL